MDNFGPLRHLLKLITSKWFKIDANVACEKRSKIVWHEAVAQPALVALSVASRYVLPGYGDRRVRVRGPGLARSLCQIIAVYALRLNSRAGTEGSTVSSLICDRWLILGSETLSISCCLNR